MRQPQSRFLATCLLLSYLSTASSQTTDGSKRGIAYLGTPHPSDYNIFLSKPSPITWYYNWSPYPVGRPGGFRNIEFVPLIHSLNSLDSDIQQVQSLGATHTHLLTFNEPDHSTDGGGTDISPADAAQAYHDRIAPLSVANGGKFYISHPSTTGTLSGLNWLQRFNESCYTLNVTHGCHMDFIATHFYGDFPALASWLGTLNEWYNANTSSNYGMWITEMALPQQDATATERMMNTTLPYLDGLEYVQKYAWFGINREENANSWTGPGVSLLDDSGDLTELGATYLNVEGGTRFTEGMSADSGSGSQGVGGRLRCGMLGVLGGLIVSIGVGWVI